MPKSLMRRAGRIVCLGLICPLLLFIPAGAIGAEEAFRLLEIDGHTGKWGSTEFGTGAVVSYAFVPASLYFDEDQNCSHVEPMDELTERSGISGAELRRETDAAFRAWEDAGDISFIPADDPARADILIGAQGLPSGRAFANVEFLPGSQDGVKTIDQARVCLNPEKPWKVGFDGDMDVYDIRYTLMHEIGHVIGLDHPGPSGQVMSFRYTERHSDLQPGDLRGVERLYGTSRRSLATEQQSN